MNDKIAEFKSKTQYLVEGNLMNFNQVISYINELNRKKSQK